jgi:prepilin-type N-terminal cleavage/methylation domain-containing protein
MKKLKIKMNRGMTYIELIVVLSIFAVLSGVVMFNYTTFEAEIDIKNLASDIALQMVTAQKAALSGLLPTQTPTVPGYPATPWKPAYGVYFNPTLLTNKSFIYFVDLNSSNTYDGAASCTGECLNKVAITGNDTISSLNVFYTNSTSAALSDLTVTFARPSSGPIIKSSTALNLNIAYVQITVTATNGKTSYIKLYPSGRVQVS